MKTISVQVQPDHLRRITSVRRPVLAVAELVWNAFDADATTVNVVLEKDALGLTCAIRVRDNGVGMKLHEAEEGFGKLGGSWKRDRDRTRKDGRLLHGRAGKGRFRAFAIGDRVTWKTCVDDDGRQEFQVEGSVDRLGEFRISDPVPSRADIGTEVLIEEIKKQFRSLEGSEAVQAITEQLALYLRKYRQVQVRYDGAVLDPAVVEEHVTDYDLPTIQSETYGDLAASLTVVEWAIPVDRALYLCDSAGFALDRTSPGIQAPGFRFTAYIKSELIRRLDESNVLELEDMNPELTGLIDSGKRQLRAHFRGRAAANAASVVADWKRDRVYPYEGDPADQLERTERQVFDVVALNVHEYLPDFAEASRGSKRLSLRLIRQALEANSEALQRILFDVLDLPIEKQNQLAGLLEHTSLGAVISASKSVADRLNFLRGLESLVFDPELKRVVRERSQLHRILENHTWIFGEHFNLTASDESLTKVLEKHLRLLRQDAALDAPVLRADGTSGIVDLLMSRVVPQHRADRREHLVVELKRPSVKIDLRAVTQLESYAFAVAEDERFRDTDTWWSFWAVSADVDEAVRRKARQKNRPDGLVHDDSDARIQIWVKSWGQVIAECQARLQFFAERLQYATDDRSALEYLSQVHAQYLPPEYQAPPAPTVETPH